MVSASEWSQLDHKTAQVQDDIEIHYVDAGPRDAPALVLVHGWPDLSFAWRHQIGPLSKKYRVIAPDLRGFGRSSAPRDVTKYGAKNVTGDLARLLDILEIPKAVFIGHDWGGAMVWRMCLYYPERVAAVCGICTPYLPPTPEYVDLDTLVAKVPQFAYQKLLAETESTGKLLDQAPRRLFTVMFRHHRELTNKVSVVDLVKNIVTSDSPAYTHQSDLLTKEEMDFYEAEYAKSGFEGTLNYYATREIDFNTERGLPIFIQHKALYIGARDDAVLKPEMAAHMPKLMPNLEMQIIDDAGHWVLWEQREKVAKALLTWLDKLELIAP